MGCNTEGADPTAGMGPRQKKLWELQQKLRASRKANQDAMVAEKRRQASSVLFLSQCPLHARAHGHHDLLWDYG